MTITGHNAFPTLLFLDFIMHKKYMISAKGKGGGGGIFSYNKHI